MSRRYPESSQLFLCISAEAEACLHRTNWEQHLENIVKLVTVIRSRITKHRERMYETELDRLVKKAKESDRNVE